ncbi:MAG: hypothetical protein BWY04_01183 [candidate division CPR1 bacterium ADurb.Bin160]|uniref:Guanylate kinase n=1 Tax=candidate division CPR1 bacterium ADurb.Bin160 TaxID=1852826 RepID=A0A1V5ZLN6_9BACT|nr:MAG: hypothetical protein BWY04_01183 [candidate division CPR1 bacterium ADurb.Bin160]
MKPMIILVGPSGGGKNYIPKTLGMKYTPGNTTREPRDTDELMTYHTLKNIKDLQVMGLFNSKICGETTFHGNYYWTYITDYNNEQNDYMILSPEGLMNFINKYKEHRKIMDKILSENGIVQGEKYLFRPYKIIYFECSEKQRKKNMKKRGDKRNFIKSRIKHDREAYKGIKELILGELNGHLIQL